MILPRTTGWEFRLSDDGYTMAFYDPGGRSVVRAGG